MVWRGEVPVENRAPTAILARARAFDFDFY